ncbi:uncharacterized protein E0L32_003342 [Thyridium curvatum]|uniref:Uncharacterized protein n=1 Tax=Thyridium curvatum TaxID=1093900 RepID=A0A507BEN7_9PEZI|nr:uncharacterized protein E0L32_003342 [Thyridium curvatum]TPX17224.1 hypothetical protein E0L32_003342 [Thyridium curvatum]
MRLQTPRLLPLLLLLLLLLAAGAGAYNSCIYTSGRRHRNWALTVADGVSPCPLSTSDRDCGLTFQARIKAECGRHITDWKCKCLGLPDKKKEGGATAAAALPTAPGAVSFAFRSPPICGPAEVQRAFADSVTDNSTIACI